MFLLDFNLDFGYRLWEGSLFETENVLEEASSKISLQFELAHVGLSFSPTCSFLILPPISPLSEMAIEDLPRLFLSPEVRNRF